MIHSLWDLFFVGDGREPIAEELSGGQFLPPVQTLVATLIFFHRQKMQIESHDPHQKSETPFGVSLFSL